MKKFYKTIVNNLRAETGLNIVAWTANNKGNGKSNLRVAILTPNAERADQFRHQPADTVVKTSLLDHWTGMIEERYVREGLDLPERYPISIADYNSAGIRVIAEEIGATHMREIGHGWPSGHEHQADYRVTFFAIPHLELGEIRVAGTNGDPVWEEQDYEVFAELAESVGVSL